MKKGIVSLLSIGVGAAIGATTVGKKVGDEKVKIQKLSDKHLELFLLMFPYQLIILVYRLGLSFLKMPECKIFHLFQYLLLNGII